MMLQIEFWQLVGLCFTGLGVFAGVLWKLVTEGLKQAKANQKLSQDQLLLRLDVIDQSNREAADKANKQERDLMQLKIDLARDYVRREDYIKGQSILEAKLDKVYEKLEVVQLKGERNVR